MTKLSQKCKLILYMSEPEEKGDEQPSWRHARVWRATAYQTVLVGVFQWTSPPKYILIMHQRISQNYLQRRLTYVVVA